MSTHRSYPRRLQARSRIRGLSLVELMISMVIGMVVVASASAIFISNRQTYRATESMARVQEGGRVSFEMMARDIRQAAGNPCAQDLPVANVLNNSAASWWSNWNNSIIGYEDNNGAFPFAAGVGGRVNGTDAIELKSADNISGLTIVSHVPASAMFHLNTPNHPLLDGDIIMVCDFQQAAVMQVTGASPGINETVVHNTGTASPGNCTKSLGVPVDCGPPAVGNPYTYGPGSTIVKMQASRWYIGNNETGGRSLFRTVLTNGGAAAATRNEEIVGGVTNMRLQYLQRNINNYVDAAAVANWANVTAVRVELTMAGNDRIGTDGNPIQRTLAHTVTLRNRMQ